MLASIWSVGGFKATENAASALDCGKKPRLWVPLALTSVPRPRIHRALILD